MKFISLLFINFYCLLGLQLFAMGIDGNTSLSDVVNINSTIFDRLSDLDGIQDSKQYHNQILQSKKMRIGIFVTSADPLHYGHIHVIRKVLQDNIVDILLVIPDVNTNYKPKMLPYRIREFLMVKAIRSSLELRYFNRIFTLPSLPAVSAKSSHPIELWDYHKMIRDMFKGNTNTQIFSIMGADTFLWYKDQEGAKKDQLDGIYINQRLFKEDQIKKSLPKGFVIPHHIIDCDTDVYSSEEVRSLLGQLYRLWEDHEKMNEFEVKKTRLKQFISEDVLGYILQNNLYRLNI